MAADPISLVREAWQDGQLAYMSEDATQYHFRNDVSLPKVKSHALFSSFVLFLLRCCICESLKCKGGALGMIWPHPGGHQHCVNMSVLCHAGL